MKELTVKMPDITYEQLQDLSERTGKSITELTRTALGLVAILYEADEKGKELAVIDGDEPEKIVAVP